MPDTKSTTDDLGERIRAVRREADLSQQELGMALGLTAKTIRRYEKGRTQPTASTLRRIADITGRPLRMLVQGTYAESTLDDPETAAQPDPPGSPALVYVRKLRIEGRDLVETGHVEAVPWQYVKRASLSAKVARILPLPSRHYRLRRALRPARSLLLLPFDTPTSLAELVRSRRLVDGPHVVTVGPSGLQVKDLDAPGTHSVNVGDLGDADPVNYSTFESDNVTVHARVVATF